MLRVGASSFAEVQALLPEPLAAALRERQQAPLQDAAPVLAQSARAERLIEAAPTWPIVAVELAEFAHRHAGECWGSWGAYDRRQIEREGARHGVADPLAGLAHVNLKASFAKPRRIKQVGMMTALRLAGLELVGEHHRALDDAVNIARLLPWSVA